MTYEVVFEIKITQGGLMVKKSSYFTIVFEGDIYYFHDDKPAIWFHHSSALDCIKQSVFFYTDEFIKIQLSIGVDCWA